MTSASNDELNRRMMRLEDVEAIRRLKALYCVHADERGDAAAQAFADLFVDEAVIDEGEEFGSIVGRARIRELHPVLWTHLRLNQHLAFSPVIDVQGDEATGHWRLLQLSTTIHPDGDRAFWACGDYRERYRRTATGWKFVEVVARVHFCCPYEDGWVKTPFAAFLPADAMTSLTAPALTTPV